MRRWARLTVVVVAIVLVIAASVGPAGAAKRAKFKVTSPAFANGKPIPIGFTCDGQSASPPLKWKNVPAGTVQIALIMEDPDTANGTFVHWVAWNIDPKASELPEETIPPTVVQGSNSLHTNKYLGPCPPRGDKPHHYRFTLYAVSQPVSVEGGGTAAWLRTAVSKTTLAKARLVGTYQRKTQPGGGGAT